MRCIIEIVAGSTYLNNPTRMEFNYENMDEFKQQFLKRFGNIGGTNNAERERFRVKQGIKQARSINEFKDVFFNASYWHLVKIKQEPASSANDTSH